MAVASSGTMTDVAGRLRTAREEAGLTIDDIAARTKIKPSMIEAIERGEFERLPGEFFVRAFLRTYAREVHVPPEDAVAEYDRSRSVAVAAPASGDAPASLPHFGAIPQESGQDRPHRIPAVVWILAAAAVTVLASMLVMRDRTPAPTGEPGAVGTAGTVAPAPVGAAPSTPAAQSGSAAPEKLSIEISPTRPLWVTGHADGKRVIFRLVQVGERVQMQADQELSFRVGDAGAFAYALNGSTGKPPGGAGEVREFRITKDNYRTFVQ